MANDNRTLTLESMPAVMYTQYHFTMDLAHTAQHPANLTFARAAAAIYKQYYSMVVKALYV